MFGAYNNMEQRYSNVIKLSTDGIGCLSCTFYKSNIVMNHSDIIVDDFTLLKRKQLMINNGVILTNCNRTDGMYATFLLSRYFMD